MVERHAIVKKAGLEDIGSLTLPFEWRMDARSSKNRALRDRPWHHEELYIPLESLSVHPESVLYWDNDPDRENSLKRVSYMLGCRAVPLVVTGGNTMRNVVDRLENRGMEHVPGYSFSRIALARRVLIQLQTEPDGRAGNYRSSNLHVIFRYRPPEGDSLEALVNTLKEREGLA